MTQTIEIKDFSGGENNITEPFNIYPTEAQTLKNVSISSMGMKTKNLKLVEMIIPPRPTLADPIQVAPQTGNIYDLTTADESYYEKVRYYQGKEFIIKAGEVYELGPSQTLVPTQVPQTLVATAGQNTTLPTPDPALTKVYQYTYFISYRNSSGYESPLEEIGIVNAHVTFSANYSVETPSEQLVTTTLPATGAYGRIYRMGGNISFPSLVFQFDSLGAITLNRIQVDFTSPNEFRFSALDSQLGDFGMTWGGVYPTDTLKYLTATKYGLATAAKSQVYLSMNKPDAWSALASLKFGSNVVAIASVNRGFLVFTESTYLYLVSGSSLSNLRVDLISTDVGCSSNSSIAEVGEHALIWIYKSRFYGFSGSSVSELEPNTYYYEFFRKYGNDKDVTGVSLNKQYIVGDNEGVVVMDLTLRYKPFIQYSLPTVNTRDGYAGLLREFLHNHERVLGVYAEDGSFHRIEEVVYNEVGYVDDFPPTDGWYMGCFNTPIPLPSICDADKDLTSCLELGGFGGYNEQPDIPVCMDGGVVGRFPEFTGTDIGLATEYKSEYISPKLTFGDIEGQCTWSSVEVHFLGELDIFVFVDDIEVVTNEQNFISSSKTTARVLFPNKQSRGENVVVKLRFNGAVYGFRVNGEPLQQLSK